MESEYQDCLKVAVALGKPYAEAQADWRAVNGMWIDYNATHSAWGCCEYEA